jgi:hypothetical protein
MAEDKKKKAPRTTPNRTPAYSVPHPTSAAPTAPVLSSEPDLYPLNASPGAEDERADDSDDVPDAPAGIADVDGHERHERREEHLALLRR